MKPWIVCLLFACLNFATIPLLNSEYVVFNWFAAGFALSAAIILYSLNKIN